MVVWEEPQPPHLSPTPPVHTCRAVRPSRGAPRGCLPQLDFLSLSTNVFLCLRSQSPCPRSPRQRPLPRTSRLVQRHWPTLTIGGKLSLDYLTSAWHDPTWLSLGNQTKENGCLHSDIHCNWIILLAHNWFMTSITTLDKHTHTPPVWPCV